MRAPTDPPGTGALLHLRARDPRSAARSASVILLLAAVALAVWTALEHPRVSALGTGFSLGVAGLLAALAVVHRIVPADRLDRVAAGALMSVAGVLLGAGVSVLTDDASAGAQFFLTLPVLWAAGHLRTAAVALVTGTTVAVDTGVLLHLLPLEEALTNLVVVGGVLVLMATVLGRAAARQEELVAALGSQARVDALTGLVNRRVFEDSLRRLSARHEAPGTALVLIDVDAFKTINDRHGHPAGDEVLVHLAGVLTEQVRSDDAVLSRLGGDELAVLLPGCSAEVARRRAEALLAAVRSRPVTLPDGTPLDLSISLGVAHLPQHADRLDALYETADAALYDAKRAGRGRVAVAA